MADTIKDAKKLYSSGKYREALAVFLSVPLPKDEDTQLELSYFIGLCYARLGRGDDAMVYLEQIVTAEKNHKREKQCRLALSLLYYKTGRFRLAEHELDFLMHEEDVSPGALCARAYIEWQQGNKQKALDLYEKVLEEHPNSTTALNGLGYVLACQNRELTRALSLCKRATDILPDSAACLDSLAWVYCQLGLYKEAKNYITRALSADAKNPEINEHYTIIMQKSASSSNTDWLDKRGETI